MNYKAICEEYGLETLVGADLGGADLSFVDLRGANLSGANLHGVDLRGASLEGANLIDANLWDVTGNSFEVASFQFNPWTVVMWCNVVQIGCKRRTWEKWLSLSDTAIARLHPRALLWWKEHKDIIDTIYKLRNTSTH